MNPDPNPDPLPPRVGCEHPQFTAVFDKLLSEVPPIQAPPLEAARAKLERLNREAAATPATVDILGQPSGDCARLLRELREAEAEVTQLEGDALPPKSYAYELWKHMSDEHGLTLLESELAEILNIAGRILKEAPCA